MDSTQFAVWLGEVADGAVLPDNCKAALMEGFAKGVIPVTSLGLDESPMDEATYKDAAELWMGLYEDAVKEAKLSDRKGDRTALKQWLRKRFLQVDVKEDETPKKAVITPEQRADMDAQGATEHWHLGFGELAIAVCRSPAREETDKFAYKAPWTLMAGGALAIKHKRTTFDDVVEKAAASGDASGIDEHMTQLSHALRADKGNPFAAVLATRALGWWQDARSKLKSPALAIEYVQIYRRRYAGRLLPVELDRDIIGEVVANALAGERSPVQHGGLSSLSKGGHKGGSETSSSVSSALGSSVSSGGSDLSKILAAVERSTASVEEVGSRVSVLADEVSALWKQVDAVDKRTTPRCHECGSTSHRVRDCPKRKDKDEKDKAAKE